MAYTTMTSTNSTASNNNDKYHALIIDSGAIIKQSTYTHLHNSATRFYTVPAVLSEIRDAQSRAHLREFQLRLSSLKNQDDEEVRLETRIPSKESVTAVGEFARKTGDYPQLSGVDLQILALAYELECEACHVFGNNVHDYVRREPKRVLGWNVKALSGDGKRVVNKGRSGGGKNRSDDSSASESRVTDGGDTTTSNNCFFEGNADEIIEAQDVDYEYDGEDDHDYLLDDESNNCGESAMSSSAGTSTDKVAGQTKSTWAKLVNPAQASCAPPLNYLLAASPVTLTEPRLDETSNVIINDHMAVDEEADGQFDDASEDSNDNSSGENDSDDEATAMRIANADSEEEMSDEECDAFVLEPHEAVYYKKLREQKMLQDQKRNDDIVAELGAQTLTSIEEDAGLDSEFPSLAAAAEVPYEGSDEELENNDDNSHKTSLDWEREEEERKKKALQPMVNGRVKSTAQPKYNSFRKYGHVLSAEGSAVSLKKTNVTNADKSSNGFEEEKAEEMDNPNNTADDSNNTNSEYKSKFTSGAVSALDTPSEMTADDDDGEGWVTCTRDIQAIKATGSLHLSKSLDSRNNNNRNTQPPKNPAPPVSQRVACATTDFAMQNVILQMNLELLTIDGVRVRRLKTWVTRCAACFTIYGSNDDKKKTGGRLFCDKCGSNTLQRIAASVDRNSGRLKLHMKKNYQYNTRGSKFSLPKAGKV